MDSKGIEELRIDLVTFGVEKTDRVGEGLRALDDTGVIFF
jgi:hypothetical protein